MATAVGQPRVSQKIWPLRRVTAGIKHLLLKATESQIWIRAHLVIDKAGSKSGHLYCELVDLDEKGRTVARMKAVIWKSNYDAISRKCREAGQPKALTDNQEICALCTVSYHKVYGLSLQIHDVDPSFGEAQLDHNRRLILEGLARDGLLDLNRQIAVPAASLRTLHPVVSRQSERPDSLAAISWPRPGGAARFPTF
jgi:exodeoxyribonuclease VII large subunit